MTVSRLVYLYLLRVPLLIGVVLVGLPFFALLSGSPGRALFENLFVLDATATFVTTISAIVLAWSLLLTGRLVLLNGQDRFGTRQLLRQNTLSKRAVLFAVILAAPMIVAQFFKVREFQLGREVGWNIFGCIAGALVAYLLAFAGLFLAVLLSPLGSQPAARTFPTLERMRRLLEWADRRTIFPAAWLSRVGAWINAHAPQGVRDGYIDPRRHIQDNQGNQIDNPGFGLPWAGHWLAFTFAIATFLLYFAIGVYKETYLGEPTSIPALAFVLLLLINSNWVLAALAFFLDRFRIPLLIPFLILAIFGTRAPSSDHYYQIQSGVSLTSIRPDEALEKRMHDQRPQKKPIILVATAGGGIQAAAWTVRVLTGLQRESLKWPSANFADSVAMISSVSGGAAGSLFFLNQYGAGDKHSGFQLPDQEGNFEQLVKMASDPSLDDVAWGLVYRDIPRIFNPYGASDKERLLDRGRMLELSWQSRSRIFGNLSNWREGVKEGWRPAAIFNATIAETGEPLLFATTDLGRKTPKSLDPKQAQPNRRSFYDLYPNVDVPLVTAVRLAASFPYVAPAARAQFQEPEYHVIDGGYYDNYGIASLVEWLDEAFEQLKASEPDQDLPPVLVLQIRSFPDDALVRASNHGWFFQIYAPLEHFHL